MVPDSIELKGIIAKFMACYFSDELRMKAHSREDNLDAPAVCKTIKKMLSLEILEYTERKYKQI